MSFRLIQGTIVLFLFFTYLLPSQAQLIEDPDSKAIKSDRKAALENNAVETPQTRTSAEFLSPRDWDFVKEFSPIFCQDFGPSIPGLSVPASASSPGKAGSVPPVLPGAGVKPEGVNSIFEWPTAHADYITRVDFDGNWISNDNWKNFESPRADFRAFAYFQVAETETHYYLHYCVFHPRDWGSIHENDLEGVMVVVEKTSSPPLGRLAYMETLSHNVFLKYHHPALGVHVPGSFGKMLTEGNHPLVYIESRGHGIHGLSEGQQALLSQPGKFVIYRHRDQAEHPNKGGVQGISYGLIPLQISLWEKARAPADKNQTFCQYRQYSSFSLKNMVKGQIRTQEKFFDRLGVSLCGNDGRPNAAHPPWAWSLNGHWFFLPAETIRKDFPLQTDTFSTTYLYHPILDIFRDTHPISGR